MYHIPGHHRHHSSDQSPQAHRRHLIRLRSLRTPLTSTCRPPRSSAHSRRIYRHNPPTNPPTRSRRRTRTTRLPRCTHHPATPSRAPQLACARQPRARGYVAWRAITRCLLSASLPPRSRQRRRMHRPSLTSSVHRDHAEITPRSRRDHAEITPRDHAEICRGLADSFYPSPARRRLPVRMPRRAADRFIPPRRRPILAANRRRNRRQARGGHLRGTARGGDVRRDVVVRAAAAGVVVVVVLVIVVVVVRVADAGVGSSGN